VLVALNGFFVAGEFALVKVRATRINQLVEEGNKAAKVVQNQIKHLDSYIAATQLGITLASLALGWIGEPSLAHLIEPLFSWLGGWLTEAVTHTVTVVISFVVITTLHIVMGELVPKSIALQRGEGTALFISRPLLLFARIFHPFILLMNGIGTLAVRAVGLQAADEHASVHSVEELEMLVVQSRQAGVLDAQEEELLRHVFDFSDKNVHAVMIPRLEIVGVPKTISLEALKVVFQKEHYTRLPVYEDTIDSIVGMVHIKDVFNYIVEKKQDASLFHIQQIMRPVLAVPESVNLDTLLTRMRSARTYLAIVINEYGETEGMVSLEDIVEELVGDVHDEFDTVAEGVREEIEYHPDGTCSVDGLMGVSSFGDRFGVAIKQRHAHTIGGYVFEELDRLPRLGDQVTLGDYTLRVEEMDKRRVARLRVQRLDQGKITAKLSGGAENAR
jgi:CBS domain containing-hemolysin-like protein